VPVPRVIGFAVGGAIYGWFLAILIDRILIRRGLSGRSVPLWTSAAIAAAVAGLGIGAALAWARLYVAFVAAAFLGVLLALAITDLRHKILPNSIVYPSFLLLAIAVAAGSLSRQGMSVKLAAIGAAAYGAPFLLLVLVAPGGMGMGDVKLAALIGLALGSVGLRYVAVAGILGVLAGGIGAIVALAAGRSRKSTLPYGPFLAVGGIAATLLAPWITRVYLR
jgi:leader peptidase (prepilin peptidase)/N-methyltransferase